VLRLPGSRNHKSSNGAAPVIAHTHPGASLTVAQIDKCLTKLGIVPAPGDDDTGDRKVNMPSTDWAFASETCPYMAAAIKGWATDTVKPGAARHYALLDRAVRLHCAWRYGCLTEDAYTSARQVLTDWFTNPVRTTDPRREPNKLELDDAWKFGEQETEKKTDEEIRAELGGHTHAGAEDDDSDGDEDETVRTVPWPTLSDAALHGVAGRIVKLAAPHTEADPAAILVHLLAILGAAIGPEPHIVVGNERHQAIINPLIVGKTNNGAKGTALAVVEAIRRRALPWFDEFTTSGLSTDVGLIERVRDPSGEEGDQDYIPGVPDKRLLVKEREYRAVLVRSRREGNTLGQTLRDAFDCCTLETLTRKRNRLRATRPHIVVIGHVTPREFRATLDDSDLSGGSVNRLLICLSRRSRLDPRLGNLPDDVLTAAAELMKDAHGTAVTRRELGFADGFWKLWDSVYPELNRDRPDCNATDATARGVTMVLRLSLLYALIDGEDIIDAEHLDAALALWAYAEHSARWLFSSHEQEIQRQDSRGLVNYILAGGSAGRTRTEIYRDHFRSNKSSKEVSAELAPLIHDGVVTEVKEETRGRPVMRYLHRSYVKSGFTEDAGQDTDPATCQATHLRGDPDDRPPLAANPDTYGYVDDA
jgi:hypothetical protein